MLENCLHYFEDDQWKESEDLIEVFPDGAIARRGPHKAIFSPDLNAEAVFDIETANGQRLRGGVRAIQVTDLATGRTEVLATVKESAPGELLAPNRVIYRDAFDGVKADVLLVWKHNAFSHDVVLRERPVLPAGMAADTTRLEALTEFVENPEPAIREQEVRAADDQVLTDHTVIEFGELDLIMGKAFAVEGEDAWTLGGLNRSDESTPVFKEWNELDDGRHFLIESVAWTEAEGQWADLPESERASLNLFPTRAIAGLRPWPVSRPRHEIPRPIQVAQTGAYSPTGYVLDFVIVSGGSPTLFQGTQTYYITNSYYSGSSVTFQSGTTIKFKTNAYMLVYGPLTFPSSQPYAVFTSRNDDLFGDRIAGVSGEGDSDKDPTLHRASEALWIYYVDFSTTVRNARFRWANKGVRYDSNPGEDVTHYVQNCLFQECVYGVVANAYSSAYLQSVQKCDVTYPTSGSGSISGSMTGWPQCDVLVNNLNNDTNQQNTQNETAVALAGTNVVVAWMDTNKGHESLGQIESCCYTYYWGPDITEYCDDVTPQFLAWAVSSDGGQTFVDKGEPPRFQYTDTQSQTAYMGDAGDPVLAVYGNTLYLVGNPERPSTYQPQGSAQYKLFLPFWKSTNLGQSFGNPINVAGISTSIPGTPTLNLVPTDASKDVLDKPWIAVDQGNGNLYLVVTWRKHTGGTTLLFFRSLDGGQTWQHREFAESGKVLQMPYVVVRGGAVHLFWRNTGTSDPIRIRRSTDQGATFHSLGQNGTITNSAAIYTGDLKRNSFYDGFEDDTFRAPSVFQAAANPQYNHLYLVYHDREPTSSPHTDILFHYSTDGGTNWTGPVVINDVVTNDQWQAAITVKPDGSKLFVGWYDRGHDLNTNRNHRIRVRGMIASITSGNPLNSQTYFDVSAEDFSPVFTGTKVEEGSFDPVYGASDFETTTDEQGNDIDTQTRCGIFFDHMGDYDQATSDNSCIYYSWGDHRIRRSGRLQIDVRFRRLSW